MTSEPGLTIQVKDPFVMTELTKQDNKLGVKLQGGCGKHGEGKRNTADRMRLGCRGG